MAALATSAPGHALDDRLALMEYARARVADATGDIQDAAEGYATVLNEAPFDEVLATRAFRRAIAAGDRRLARQAADALYANGVLPPDGQLLFLADAMTNRDWRAASAVVDRIEEDGLFASLAPMLRAWIALGEDRDPFALLDSPELENSPYLHEHRALLLLAAGRHAEGIDAIRALDGLSPARRTRILLGAAATLASRGQDEAARALIQGEQGRAFRHARERLAAGDELPGEIVAPSQGVAELLTRLAADIGRRDADSLALTLTRYASFVAPDNPIAWLLAANLLAQDAQYGAALAALGSISPQSPYFAEAQDLRVGALLAQDERDQALALVRQHTSERDADVSDWLRFAGLYSELDRHEDAVEAYERALRLERQSDDGEALWSTWLLYGGALLDAGRWEDSKQALDRALALAPDEPVLLNYLGYALLERREQLDRAEELIRQASEMRPDNAAITDSLGWVLFVRGKHEEAIATLERAVLADPDEPTINEHLGDAYWAVGRRRDARFAWQAALVSAEDEAARRIHAKLDFGLTSETASP